MIGWGLNNHLKNISNQSAGINSLRFHGLDIDYRVLFYNLNRCVGTPCSNVRFSYPVPAQFIDHTTNYDLKMSIDFNDWVTTRNEKSQQQLLSRYDHRILIAQFFFKSLPTWTRNGGVSYPWIFWAKYFEMNFARIRASDVRQSFTPAATNPFPE